MAAAGTPAIQAPSSARASTSSEIRCPGRGQGAEGGAEQAEAHQPFAAPAVGHQAERDQQQRHRAGAGRHAQADRARRNPESLAQLRQQRLRAVEQQEAGKPGQAQGQRDALGVVVGARRGRQVWARWAERRGQDAIETPAGVAGNWYYPKRPFDTDETMHYDLPDLRLVAAIADSGSLTRAAVRTTRASSPATA
jgi:hypothetical protein